MRAPAGGYSGTIGPSRLRHVAHAIGRRRREQEHVRSVERLDRRRRAGRGRRLRPPALRQAPASASRRARRRSQPRRRRPRWPPCAHLAIRIVGRARTRRLHHARRDLTQRRDVIHDPERPPHRRRDEVAVVDLEVGDRRRGQVLLQRLPVLALIERDVHALERAGVQQPLLFGILAHDVHRLIGGNAVRAVGQQRPVLRRSRSSCRGTA